MRVSTIQWRDWWEREQQLIRELMLMLLVAVIIGIYFLEHARVAQEQAQRQSAEALAAQLASSASEYIASGNLVSLNVMASQTAALPLVARVEFRNAADRVQATAGESRGVGEAVSRPVRVDEETLGGTVTVWVHDLNAEKSRRLETNFALVTLSLLMLRLLVALAWRRLSSTPEAPMQEDELLEADLVPVLEMTQTSEAPKAWLRVAIVNFERMQGRLTSDLMREMLQEYGALLKQVAQVYGARMVFPLGQQAALQITADSRSEAAFQALCAGTLFRRLARELTEQRKEAERTPLEFKLLVTTQQDMGVSWALCVSGLPGRVHVPEAEMIRLELDTRLLFHGERCLNILADGETVRLQPIEQLAQRYQKLIAEQAGQLQGQP